MEETVAGTDDVATWVVGARSETGYARSENQDRMSRISTVFGEVFIVSDGMGGHKGGAVAAEMTIETIQKHMVIGGGVVDVGEAVRKAVEAANQTVYAQANGGDAETEGMGATALVVVTRDASALVAHVGDSRAYLFRDGRLQQLTVDHTRVQRMLEAKMLSPAEAEAHPDASLLERAIGHKAEIEVEVAPWLKLQKGDHLLLCSDGLSGYVEDTEIEAVMSADSPPQTMVDELVELSLSKGGNDNVTIQVIRYGDPMAKLGPGRMLLYQAAFLPLSALVAGVVAYAVGDHGLAPQLDKLREQTERLSEQSSSLRIDIARIDSALNALPARTQERVTPVPLPGVPPGSAKGVPPAATQSQPPRDEAKRAKENSKTSLQISPRRTDTVASTTKARLDAVKAPPGAPPISTEEQESPNANARKVEAPSDKEPFRESPSNATTNATPAPSQAATPSGPTSDSAAKPTPGEPVTQ